MGHVNNAAFFTYCESARMSYFGAIEIDRWSRESALTAKPRVPRSDLDAGASVDHL
jgi:acyl-CoA thioesterase FadM